MKMISDRLWMRRPALFPVLAAHLTLSISCAALTISSGPSFTPAANAPLAGTLALITDEPSRVSVSVSDGTNTWERSFYDYRTAHSFPLLGFKPARTNQITVTVQDKLGDEVTAAAPINFITGPLPSDFPKMVLLSSQPDKLEPGYTLFAGQNNGAQVYIIIVDSSGEVVWYTGAISLDIRQLPNGNLFAYSTTASNFFELNMLGQTVRSWKAPNGWPLDSHDAVPTDHGTILYLSAATDTVTNFPTSATNPNAPRQTARVWHQPVVEISATNSAATNAPLLNSWRLIDILDPRRISYLTFSTFSPYGVDWSHSNALIEDPSDNSLIVSLRHQNAVIKFSRATGQLKWILGPHENWGPAFQPYLLTPVGLPFEWNYGQHAPMLTPQGTLLLYDDGDARASPFEPLLADPYNYSRAVEYVINEDTMEVSQVWEYGKNIAERLYTPSVGDANWLTNSGNVLITFGNITYVNGASPSPYSASAAMVRIKEVTHDQLAEVVFDLALFDFSNTNSNYRGCFAYRSNRIPDLYSTQAQPVQDLIVKYQDGSPRLEFSANAARTYLVEASIDLVQWDEIGAAERDANGNFHFDDLQAEEFPARYYRVVTR